MTSLQPDVDCVRQAISRVVGSLTDRPAEQAAIAARAAWEYVRTDVFPGHEGMAIAAFASGPGGPKGIGAQPELAPSDNVVHLPLPPASAPAAGGEPVDLTAPLEGDAHCPFCQAPEPLLVHQRTAPARWPAVSGHCAQPFPEDEYWLTCASCGSSGPSGLTPDEAREFWSDRTKSYDDDDGGRPAA